MKNFLIPMFAVALALTAAPTVAAETDAKFTMSVFVDAAQGPEIVAGKYDEAISTIAKRSSRKNAIEATMNLCVAYVKSGEVELAEDSCDAAVTAIHAQKSFRRFRMGTETTAAARERYLAMALSNRSVIRAIKGDYESAREDLDEALQLDTRLTAAKTNLERLSVAEKNAA